MSEPDGIESSLTTEEELQARTALNLFADAIEAAGRAGVPTEVIGNAALTAALRMMVSAHGAEVVAEMLRQLPEQVVAGDFSG